MSNRASRKGVRCECTRVPIGSRRKIQLQSASHLVSGTWYRRARDTHASIKLNGLIERLHATLWSRTRAIIHARDVPISLWPVLVQAVSYLRSQLSVTSLNGASLWARLHGRPVPCLKHLRVLGAPFVVLVPTLQGKLLPRGQQGIMVGYTSDGRNKTAVFRVYISTNSNSAINDCPYG
jgi:hypothetical protein